VNFGREIEDVVENLCKKSFFADFTIRNPKYRKLCGEEKEAADLLVVFNNTLLAIQVKSKQVDSSSQSCRIELDRLSKSVDKAMHQFRALTEALNSPQFKSFRNARGVEIAFEKNKVTEVILVVVFAPIWPEKGKPAQIRFDTTCYPDGPIPIHLFTLRQFSLLLLLLDTLPDFILYLTARWMLHGEKLIPPDSDPADEWALTTFEGKRLIEMYEKRIFADITGLNERHQPSLVELERREKPSYFIDRLIEQLYAAIGSGQPVDKRFNLLAEPNSLKAYQMTIPYLAKLNRKDRGQLVEFLVNRVMQCQKQEIAFRGFKFDEDNDDAYLVLAAKFKREERRIALANVAMGMGHKLKAKTIIGIAVSNDWPDLPTCDVAVIDVSELKPSAKLIEMTDIAFSKRPYSRLRR